MAWTLPVHRTVCVLGLLLTAVTAHAESYDFAIGQYGSPTPGAPGFRAAANSDFRAFARELGAGLTASVLEPANSLGLSGFSVEAETSVVRFATNSATFRMPIPSTFPGLLWMPGVHVRKGLPFSVEVGAKATWVGNTGMAAGTVEARWTVTEGIAGWPAVAVRGAFTKLFNARDFSLQTGGIDLSVGKRFVVGGMLTLSPYLSYGLGWTYATTHTLNLDASRSDADSEKSAAATFVNTAKYQTVSAGDNAYNRLSIGGRFTGGIFTFGVEGTLSSPGSFADETIPETKTRNLPVLFALNASAGLVF